MKKLVQEFQLQQSEQAEVKRLARVLGLSETVTGILYARGMDTEEKMRAFLSPSKEHFLSPFLMQGMREAVELITTARDEEWRVAVFGDYDADGIGATAILSRALKEFGIEPYLYVPERSDGYGMSVSAIDKIFDEFLPDLLITVDCGISNRKEVEYIKEQGAYVIVTDHHELPDELPECIVINPKLKDDYPYDNLCGAGVAFKLSEALIGERARSLLDFAALSTVADSVPLLGENRDIVAEGLKLMATRPRPALSMLLGKTTDLTAQTLAFTVAPRINAAGRMGDAKAALAMFTTDDEDEIKELAGRLETYNVARQKICDDLFSLALAEIYGEGAYGNVVMLAGEGWHAGAVGIVAARLTEQFSRPALLFVRHGDMLRGSARSVDEVNIFEALKACSEYIEEFGGHAQAAGVNVKVENFEPLKHALNAYLSEHYPREAFLPSVIVSGRGGDFHRVAHELERLEPFGVGNRRPLFALEANATNAAPLKPASPHVSLCVDKFDLIQFNGAKMLKTLRSDLHKTVVFDYNLSNFRGREYVKGFVRAVVLESGEHGARLDALENRLRALRCEPLIAETYSIEQLNQILEEKISGCAFGLCCVCRDGDNLSRYPALGGVPRDVFQLSSGNVGNTVLVAPDEGVDLSPFRDVVFLDSPAAAVNTGSAKIYACSEEISGGLRSLDALRETLLSVFAAIRGNEMNVAGDTFADAARNCKGLGFDLEEFVFAMLVFEELGLISFGGGLVKVVRGKKTELTNSKIYSAVARLREA